MDLFRKKSVDQLVAESTPLKRTMRTFDLTMLGIGAIIGTGIFVLTGKGALTAGPALSVSFLLAAVCCGFAGLCYAEFAAWRRFPARPTPMPIWRSASSSPSSSAGT